MTQANQRTGQASNADIIARQTIEQYNLTKDP